MTRSLLRSRAGFTYVTALVMVVIMGIMLAQGAQVWSTRMQREREVELIFRGTQIRDAMRRWYNKKVVAGALVPASTTTTARGNLPELKALVTDPNMLSKVHFLRPSNLVDPMTGKDWAIIKNPTTQQIIGVASSSEAQPIKQANFSFDLMPADFEGKKKYSEWQFIYDRVPAPGAIGGGVTGLKTTTSPTAKTAP